MAWKKNRHRWQTRPENYPGGPENLYGFGGSEEQRSYCRNVDHLPKELTEEERQRREWRENKSQWREQEHWRSGWKREFKHYCARYYRAWLRYQIAHENWEAFVSDNREYKFQEDPWSWD